MRQRIHFRYLLAGDDEVRSWTFRYETIYKDQLMETVNELAVKGHSFFAWRSEGLERAGIWTFIDPDYDIDIAAKLHTGG